MVFNAVPSTVLIMAIVWAASAAYAQVAPVDDAPGGPGEWGFRPAEDKPSPVNPPGFAWRPQKGAVTYELQCARDPAFSNLEYRIRGMKYNCHCPPKVFEQGEHYWRFRFTDRGGGQSDWSRVRSFTIGADAVQFPMPGREEMLARIPRQHPRLFVRPEQLPELRARAQGDLREQFEDLVSQCEELLNDPPSSEEPPRYPPGVRSGSDEWRQMWWGNRTYTIKLLNGAATLAFTRRLGGKEEYGQLARRLLLAAAEWDPKGSTGYRYNDEAGMPYNYYFSRAYTFVNDLLSEEEKEKCRRVMAVRGRQMYEHLSPRHLWRPYASHSNRAWHFLGEVGIAFLDEIPDAEEWLWFAMNVFYNVYPVWCDDDGGWHEGANYWGSYVGRFTWWADVMRAATGIDAYKKPYFSKVGYYPMYLQPPGTRGGGFGDLNARRRSRHNLGVMTTFAAHAGNQYWQWYVDAHGGPRPEKGYVGFVRGALPSVEARTPTDLPASRCFWGTGQAVLNTNLLDAKSNVELIFKSSPFGGQSHGYEAQNSFLLYAFGERLLIRTGRRDSWGSTHHKEWMWHTKSVNNITVNGRGQEPHSRSATGEITAFHTSPTFDYVSGEAGSAYGPILKRFTRAILFVKPDLIVVYDRLEAPAPSAFEWRLHSPTEMTVHDQRDIYVSNKEAACRVSFLAPEGLKLSLTDKFDPPPRPRVKLVEWHLTAQTPQPAERMEFVTVIRPHRASRTPPAHATLHKVEAGYALETETDGGRVVVLMRAREEGTLAYAGLSTDAELAAAKFDRQGKPTDGLVVEGRTVRAGREVASLLTTGHD